MSPLLKKLTSPSLFHRVWWCCALLFLGLLLALTGCAGKNPEPSPPKQVQAHLDVASAFLREGRPRRSLKELLTVQEKADAYPDFHFLAGITYTELEDSDKAVKHFRQAVEIKPDFGEAWNNLGQVHATNQQWDKAIQAFERALEIQTYFTPEFPAFNLATVYKAQGEYDRAISYAEKALKFNWRYLRAYQLISKLYLDLERTKQAAVWLKRGVKAFPDNASLMYRLAVCQHSLGHTSDAIYWFKRIKKIQPNSKEARDAQDYLDILED